MMASLLQAWRELSRNDQVILFFLAVVIGTASGYGALAFRLLVEGLQFILYGNPADFIASQAARLPWWQILIVPTLGGLVIGLFTHYVMPGRLPQGVAGRDGSKCASKWPDVFSGSYGRRCGQYGSIGCGASVGREGPIVHLGATFASKVAQALHLRHRLPRPCWDAVWLLASQVRSMHPSRVVFLLLRWWLVTMVLPRFHRSSSVP